MKHFVLGSLLFAGLTSSALAGPAKPSSSTLSSAIQVLNLPSENRRILVQEQGLKHYDSFISVAFDEDQPMSLRWRALVAASEAGGPKAVPQLLKAGQHKQWFMRNAALVALSEVDSEAANKLATELLKDKALVVRSAAVIALEKRAAGEVRDLLWSELNQTYNYKNNESLWIRHQIVEVLAKKPLDNELKVFANLLSDKDDRLQAPAVRGLERLTGVKLDTVGLWKDYVKKEKLDL